jgi:hypothetical protein
MARTSDPVLANTRGALVAFGRFGIGLLAIAAGCEHTPGAARSRGAARPPDAADETATRTGGYPLDAISRELDAGDPGRCPEQIAPLVYRGETLRYARPVEIAAPFSDKLRAFERVVVQLARAHYGRAPVKLMHAGGRVCRPMRGNARRLSEHALGNALDVSGFAFGRASASEALPAGAPAALERAFVVTVRKHWVPTVDTIADPAAALHSRFLRKLVERVDALGVFRGIVGPGREGHAGHLHFDFAPWDYTLL